MFIGNVYLPKCPKCQSDAELSLSRDPYFGLVSGSAETVVVPLQCKKCRYGYEIELFFKNRED